MKKLVLTSPAFNGEVEVLYDVDNKLVLIDLQNSEMSETQIKYLKDNLPVHYSNKQEFNVALNSKTLSIVELDFEVTFEMFYAPYPKKRNPDRCKVIWEKMTKADRLRAYSGAKTYARYCANNAWYNPLIPENFLKKKEWLNEWK